MSPTALSNTVFHERVDPQHGDRMRRYPPGTAPTFPFQKTLNGSTGLNSTEQFNGGQPIQGIPVTGAPWTPYTGPGGMVFNPNPLHGLVPIDGVARRDEQRAAGTRHVVGFPRRVRHAHERLQPAELYDSRHRDALYRILRTAELAPPMGLLS
jgi:hypothetical protein